MWSGIYDFFYELFYRIAIGCGFDEAKANFFAKWMCILMFFEMWIFGMAFIIDDIV